MSDGYLTTCVISFFISIFFPMILPKSANPAPIQLYDTVATTWGGRRVTHAPYETRDANQPHLFPRCNRGQRNTHGITGYLPSSSCTSSQLLVIGWVLLGLTGEEVRPCCFQSQMSGIVPSLVYKHRTLERTV